MQSLFTILHKAIRMIITLCLILLQQGVVIGMGALAYAQVSPWLAGLVWLLVIPMIWVNQKTWAYIQRYGIIHFFTALSDTSEIDVPREKRWYHQD